MILAAIIAICLLLFWRRLFQLGILVLIVVVSVFDWLRGD